MADELLSDIEGEGSDDSKPASKGDEKKSKHLNLIGIVIGVLAIYLGYRWYENRQANAATTTSTVVPTAPTTGDATGAGSGGGGGWSGYGSDGTNTNNDNALATDLSGLTSALNGFTAQLQSTQPAGSNGGGGNSGSDGTGTTGGGTSGGTTGTDTGNAYASPTTPLALSSGSVVTPAQVLARTGSNIGGPTGITPTQATAAVQSGTLTPEAALQSETPAASETAAQRHAQEVQNRSLRALAKA